MEGVAAETVARSQAKARFQIMFMGIMSSELRVPRPCLSWVPDTLEERTDAVEKLAEINKYWEGKMEQQIKLAETPGTEEYIYMRNLNQNITETGREGSGWVRPREAHQEYRFKPYTRGRKTRQGEVSKGGIDWFSYREKVLLPLIYSVRTEGQDTEL